MKKDTIYIDIDDDITVVIDKVKSANQKIIALVLPKRASVMQSVVNMKLLKKTADTLGKRVVLITSEDSIFPLAGNVGLHIAKNLQSKPMVPHAVDATKPIDEIISESDNTDLLVEDLAPLSPIPKKLIINEEPVVGAIGSDKEDVSSPIAEDEEVVAFDNSDPEAPAAPTEEEVEDEESEEKSLRVPNFTRFRMIMMFAILGVILLGVLGYYGLKVLPKASIIVRVDQQTKLVQLDVIGDTTAATATDATIPAKIQEKKEVYIETFAATGSKDLGAKATGTVTMTACTADGSGVTIPSGTGLSAGGKTYITQKTVVLTKSFLSGGSCAKVDSPKSYETDIPILAVDKGESFNQSTNTVAVTDFATVQAEGLVASGGSTKVAKVVSDQDVEAAKTKLNAKLKEGVNKELKAELEKSSMIALDSTYVEEKSGIVSSPAANTESSDGSAKLTLNVTYRMYGVDKLAIQGKLTTEVKKSLDANQTIADNGMSTADVSVTDKSNLKAIKFHIKSSVILGTVLDEQQIAKDAVGKKRGEIQNMLTSKSGVKEVEVNYSPFWVYKAPAKAEKITVKVEINKTNAK